MIENYTVKLCYIKKGCANMKYGLMIEKDTRNIGDDIQAYAARRFLPRVDYLVDRNHLDEFVPDNNEYVATIINGWFLQYTLNWPLSPFIKPLPISMHFTYKDWFWDTTDRPYHLQGYGLEYLKSIEPIGCRDSHSQKLLNEKGIETIYTGCMTLTINKLPNVEKQKYICAVDVSDKVVKKIKESTDMEVKIITHTVPEDYYKLPWDERMKNVEELLKVYQGASAVVSYRLHCALPCLALGTPVVLLNEDYRNDRFGDYTKYIESCSEEDFISGKVEYDFENIPKKSDEWHNLRDNLVRTCENFIKICEENDEEYEKISVQEYKDYVIKKSNWLKEATLESYNRFEREKNKHKQKEEEVARIIDEKENEKSRLLAENAELKKYYETELEKCYKEISDYKDELKAIKNSKWWKLRNKIKGINE